MSAFTAAGVLPYSVSGGCKHYYFGHERSTNTLTTFCGKKNKNEKTLACAIREFGEESLGAIAKKKHVYKCIKNGNSTKKVANLAVKQMTYIAKVNIKGDPVKKFEKKIKKPGLKKHQKEIKKIVEISGPKLRQLVSTGQTSYKGIKFRADTFGTLQKALANNQL